MLLDISSVVINGETPVESGSCSSESSHGNTNAESLQNATWINLEEYILYEAFLATLQTVEPSIDKQQISQLFILFQDHLDRMTFTTEENAQIN